MRWELICYDDLFTSKLLLPLIIFNIRIIGVHHLLDCFIACNSNLPSEKLIGSELARNGYFPCARAKGTMASSVTLKVC